MKKKKQRRLIRAGDRDNFYLVLFVFLLINIIVPDKEKSVQENRMLASAPKWNWGNVDFGRVIWKSLKRYMSDQLSAEISGERSKSVWTDWQVSARNMEYI